MKNNLEQAYIDTTYVVFNNKENFNLKTDSSNLKFNQWCVKNKINTWAIITAFNPFSEELTKKKNDELNCSLKGLLIKNNYSFNNARGVPNNSNWEAEDSFFIHNISFEKAQKIGVLYKQNAIVYGLKDGSIKIVWLV